MKTFYSPSHLGHDPGHEFEGGRLTPAVEVPERAEAVRGEVEKRKLGPVLAPDAFADDAILRVHDAGLVKFLSIADQRWRER
jgi:acetoin utilization deacetylase AcuC-like enzyme